VVPSSLPPLARPARQPAYRALRDSRPYGGSAHSLEAMRRMARAGEDDADVRRWALAAVRGVEPKRYLDEAAAVYYATCRSVRYTRDPAHTEQVAHPAVTLGQRAGDCDDMATGEAAGLGALRRAGRFEAPRRMAAMGAALGALGSDVEFAAVAFRPGGPDPYTHVFLRIRDPRSGEWAIMDPVAGPRTADMARRVTALRAWPVGP